MYFNFVIFLYLVFFLSIFFYSFYLFIIFSLFDLHIDFLLIEMLYLNDIEDFIGFIKNMILSAFNLTNEIIDDYIEHVRGRSKK